MPVTAINHYLVVSKNLERSKKSTRKCSASSSPSGLISVFPATG